MANQTQKLSLSGSQVIDMEDISNGEEVAFIVLGRCIEHGTRETATQGDVEKRVIKLQGIVPLSGAEAKKAIERVRSEMVQGEL